MKSKMRAIIIFVIIAVLAIAEIIFSFNVNASVWDEQGPSVFEQMQDGSADPIYAHIEDVQLKGYKVTYLRLGEGAGPQVRTQNLCVNDDAVNSGGSTEADRALAINLRVQALLRAKRNHETIQLGVRGPHNGCVYPISI